MALARKRRGDRGERRVVSAKPKEVIEGLSLQKPPLPLAVLFRQVQRISKDLGEKAPSYGTVFSIVRDLGADLVTPAHEGTKAYSNTFEFVHRRESAGPNAIWQADHTPLDILLIRRDGKTAKPWLSTVIDDYSRDVAGYFLSFQDPSAFRSRIPATVGERHSSTARTPLDATRP